MKLLPKRGLTRAVLGVALATATAAGTFTYIAVSSTAQAADGVASLLSDADLSTMRAQLPLTQAADTLSMVVDNGDGAYASGYAGIELIEGAVNLYWKGDFPVSLQPTLAEARRTATVNVVAKQFSLQESTEAAHYLLDNAQTVAGGIVATDVVVGQDYIQAITPENVRTLKSAPTSANGIPVRMETGDAGQPTSRTNDVGPFYSGGSRLQIIGKGQCTSSFGTVSGHQITPANFMLSTAGHCGAIGDTVKNNGNPIGRMEYSTRTPDLALVSAQNVSNRIYDGDGEVQGNKNQFFKSVVGWNRTYIGEDMCHSGSFSGARCEMKVTSLSYSYNWDGTTYYNLAKAKAPGISWEGPTHGGDSGGPVFTLAGNSPRIPRVDGQLDQSGQVVAKGVIHGGGGARNEMLFTTWSSVFQYTNRVPATSPEIRTGRVNNFCVDINMNQLNQNPSGAWLYTCSGSVAQKLAWNTWGDNSIRVAANGKCLDADLPNIQNNGARVQFWDCNGSGQQKWVFTVDGEIRSGYNTNKCLDADLNTIGRNGTRIQLWDCNGSLQQKWWR